MTRNRQGFLRITEGTRWTAIGSLLSQSKTGLSTSALLAASSPRAEPRAPVAALGGQVPSPWCRRSALGLRRAHGNRGTNGRLFPTRYTVINQNNQRAAWMQRACRRMPSLLFLFKITLLVPTLPSRPFPQLRRKVLSLEVCALPSGGAIACE